MGVYSFENLNFGPKPKKKEEKKTRSHFFFLGPRVRFLWAPSLQNWALVPIFTPYPPYKMKNSSDLAHFEWNFLFFFYFFKKNSKKNKKNALGPNFGPQNEEKGLKNPHLLYLEPSQDQPESARSLLLGQLTNCL